MKRSCITYFLFSFFPFINYLNANEPVKEIAFTENKGQVSNEKMEANASVLYSGTNGKIVYHLKNEGISYQLNVGINQPEFQKENLNSINKDLSIQKLKIYRVDLNWIDAKTEIDISNGKLIEGSNNYYLESCPKGILGVRSYLDVSYKNIYDGIGVKFYSKNGKLKYDYLVSAGADYKKIKLKINGAEEVYTDQEGNLVIKNEIGKIIEGKPVVIQKGRELESRWIVKGNVVSFVISGIDKNESFVIDPEVRVWGTFFGGVGDDYSFSTSVNSKGDVFITGSTTSINSMNICTSGAYQTIISNYSDGFISKFDSKGKRIWSTYYGGLGRDKSNSCSASNDGGVFICGETDTISNVFASLGCHQNVYGGGTKDAFVAKFDSLGARLWGTFYGGISEDLSNSCKLDKFGDLVVVGTTLSSNNIVTPNAYRTVLGGGFDVFIVKFNDFGQRLWGTYYGGDDRDEGNSCSTDSTGTILIAGTSRSGNGYMAMGGGLGFIKSNTTAYLTNAYLGKFDRNGNWIWTTFYGAKYVGECYPICHGFSCHFDSESNMYLVGATNHNSPIDGISIATPGSFQPNKYGSAYSLDGFLVKFNSSGNRIWSTYYSNYGEDYLIDCKTDKKGNLYVAGMSHAGNAVPNTNWIYGGYGQGFFVKFDSIGNRLFHSNSQDEYYGGGRSIAVGDDNSIFLTGNTTAPNFPQPSNITTPGSSQPNYGGGNTDAFLMKFQDCSGSLNVVAPNYLICKGHTNTLTASGSTSYTWSTGSNASSITISPSVTTIYTVSTTSGTCNLSSFVEIVVSTPSITASSNQSVICAGQTATLNASGANYYYWNSPNASVSGSLVVVSPSITTTYSIFAYGAYGCTATALFSQNVASCIGISEYNGTDEFYKVFPNPATNEIHLFCTDLGESSNIEIIDLAGKVLLQKKILKEDTSVDIEFLQNGIYFVRYNNGTNQRKTTKLIKQ